MRDDLYATLGIDAAATADDITTAFRARAKELHPDLHPGDAAVAERFKRLTNAYRTLSRPAARAAYDARRRAAPASSPAPPTAPARVVHEPVFRTPGRARAAIWAGVGLLLLGLAVGGVLTAVPTGGDAKTITLWIVAVKLALCGVALWVAGWWRLRRLRADAFATGG
jgi:hypothetical protein